MSKLVAAEDGYKVAGIWAEKRQVIIELCVDDAGVAHWRGVPIAEIDEARLTDEERQRVRAWREHWARLDAVV